MAHELDNTPTSGIPSVFAYARQEGWREALRVAALDLVKPLVFPIHRFVERNYHTENRLRLAKVSGLALWWRLGFNAGEGPRRPGEPRTADEVIDRIYDYADLARPL